MRLYRIRYTDTVGHPRIETVAASSAYEAIKNVHPNEGEIIESVEVVE